MDPVIISYVYKAVASAAVGVIMAVILWPFRKARKEWLGLTGKLEAVHTELATQRQNCLSTLQSQGESQIELLGKTVAALDGVRLDLAEQTGCLRAMTAQPPRRRRTTKK